MFSEEELPEHLVPAAKAIWDNFANTIDQLETKENDDYIRLAGHVFERVLLSMVVHMASERIPTATICTAMFDMLRKLQDEMVYFARDRGKENAGDAPRLIHVPNRY